MAESVLPTEVEVAPTASMVSPISRRRRLFALGVVLSVSILHFVFASFYYLLGGGVPLDAHQNAFRLGGALLAESTSLLVLWYVLSERGSGLRAIGWTPAWKDLPEGFGLLMVGYLVTIPPALIFQAAYLSYAGHYLHAKSLESMLGFGISVFSIAFVLLNPFFEELIVRAYTMSEIMDLGGSRLLAIVVSVSLQMSYHFYQGVLRSIAIAATLTVFSIYFARTRRIAPIILAHFCFDALALVRRTF